MPPARSAADPPRGAPARSPGSALRVHRVGDVTVLELHGEIDIAASHRCLSEFDAATMAPGAHVVVDLSHVTFFDCSGLRLLCRAHRRQLEHGGSLGIVCAQPLTLRVLRAARLMGVLRPVPTLEQALRPETCPEPDAPPAAPQRTGAARGRP
ncbi:STAS domain-containing protein [Streptomyces sparsus]